MSVDIKECEIDGLYVCAVFIFCSKYKSGPFSNSIIISLIMKKHALENVNNDFRCRSAQLH